MSRIEAVLRKEVKELITNRAVVWTLIGIPALFLALPLALTWIISRVSPEEISELEPALRELRRILPALAGLSPLEQGQVMMIRQFSTLFLGIPIIGALSSTTYSIVGEKQNRSLEPLLVSPVETWELFLGKSLGALLPSLAITWLTFAAYALFAWILFGNKVVSHSFDASTLLMIAVLTPLVGLLGLAGGVVVSSRSTDPRGAQQIGGVLVIPVIFLLVGQMSGLVVLGPLAVAVSAVGFLILDVLLLAAGSRLFDREKIMTQWK